MSRLARLAAEVGTPFYCYSTATLQRHYRVLTEAFAGQDALICFAVKANSNQAVLRTLAKLGAGMDVVSEGELRRALAAGVPASKIIFAGVGKTREEMAYALEQGILGFNVESEPELRALSEVAEGLGHTAHVALRVNPGRRRQDARQDLHRQGGEQVRHSLWPGARSFMPKPASCRGIAVAGIHMHIGSQITDLEPFRNAFRLMRKLAEELIADGHKLAHLDIGGGLGVPYMSDGEMAPPPSAYAQIVKEQLGDLGLKIVLEPGRVIVGNAGVLVTRVIYGKEGVDKTFTVVDAAMNDLIRPTLYEAQHEIWPVQEAKSAMPPIVQDIVGPVCETGDYLALDRSLPPLQAEDLIAVMTAGAYGAVMSSSYNTRPLVPEVLVNGADYAVVRPRIGTEAIIALDRVPAWLK